MSQFYNLYCNLYIYIYIYILIVSGSQILEKKWEYDEAVHRLFIDFKKASDSLRREVLYNILIEFRIPKEL